MSSIKLSSIIEESESFFAYQDRFRGGMNQEEINTERKKYKNSIDHHKNEQFIKYMLQKYDQVTKLQVLQY